MHFCVILVVLGRLLASFWRSWSAFGPHFGSLGPSWHALLAQVGPSWPKIAKKHRFFEFELRMWDPSWEPKLRKIDPVFHNICRVSPKPPLFTAYARPRNFNHPVGCFPSSTQKPKISRSGPPGVFRGAPWAPQLGKMVLQGAQRCLKVPSRHLKSPFWAEEGNQKKASIPSRFLTIVDAKIGGTVQNFE